MRSIIWIGIIAVVWIGATNAYEQTLEFTDCSGIYYAHVNKRYKLEWDGDAISKYSRCKVTFHGYEKANVLDEYKICIKATKWQIYDDVVTLRYYSANTVLSDDLKKEYTATSFDDSPKTEWCSEPEDYVDVELITDPSLSNQGEIILEVYAVMTFDYSKTVGAIVGGIIGGVAVIAIIVTVVVICMCRGRSRAQAGRVLGSQNTGVNVQQGAQPIPGGYGTPYNVDSPPPSYYNATNVPQNAMPVQSGHTYQPVPTSPPQ